jgi:hypothetical protein
MSGLMGFMFLEIVGFSDYSNQLVKDKDSLQELVRTSTCLKTKS